LPDFNFGSSGFGSISSTGNSISAANAISIHERAAAVVE
jgi:hypothetical protein